MRTYIDIKESLLFIVTVTMYSRMCKGNEVVS